MSLTTNLVSYYKFDGDVTDSVDINDDTVSGALTPTEVSTLYNFGNGQQSPFITSLNNNEFWM